MLRRYSTILNKYKESVSSSYRAWWIVEIKFSVFLRWSAVRVKQKTSDNSLGLFSLFSWPFYFRSASGSTHTGIGGTSAFLDTCLATPLAMSLVLRWM